MADKPIEIGEEEITPPPPQPPPPVDLIVVEVPPVVAEDKKPESPSTPVTHPQDKPVTGIGGEEEHKKVEKKLNMKLKMTPFMSFLTIRRRQLEAEGIIFSSGWEEICFVLDKEWRVSKSFCSSVWANDINHDLN